MPRKRSPIKEPVSHLAPPQPVPVVLEPKAPPRPPVLDDIRLRAYLLWEAAGKPNGTGEPFWLQAERELSN